MSGTDLQRERLLRDFEAQRERFPGSPETERLRRSALDEFAARGFPTRRDEAWHYTDLRPIVGTDFEFVPSALASPGEAPLAAPGDGQSATGDGGRHPAGDGRRAALERLLAEAAGGEAGPRAVFVDGRFDSPLSRPGGGEGLEVVALAADPARFAAALARRPVLDGHPLAALNAAFAPDGAAIGVAAGHAAAEPLHLYFVADGEGGLAAQPRLSIDLGPGAELTVVVHCLDAPGPGRPDSRPAGWLNVVTHVSLAARARLKVYRLQEHGPDYFETSLLAAELAEDASLEVGYVDLGGRLVRNDIDVRLLEPGARAALFGVFVASAGQHIDNHTNIEHAAPSTTSDEAFRGIADRNGRGVFSGKVVVHPGAQHIDARQSSDNLLLADGAEIDTRPQLEIYADDVKCSHGATVGELDAEQLFYLRARGIEEPTARSLLTFAFANSVLARLEPEALRARATARVAGQLPDAGLTEALR